VATTQKGCCSTKHIRPWLGSRRRKTVPTSMRNHLGIHSKDRYSWQRNQGLLLKASNHNMDRWFPWREDEITFPFATSFLPHLYQRIFKFWYRSRTCSRSDCCFLENSWGTGSWLELESRKFTILWIRQIEVVSTEVVSKNGFILALTGNERVQTFLGTIWRLLRHMQLIEEKSRAQ